MRRSFARGIAAGLVAGLLALGLIVTSSQSAQAFDPGITYNVPSVAARVAGVVEGWGGMATAAGSTVAPYAVAAASGLLIGYGIGWTGVQTYGFLKDKFFTDHPPATSTITRGSCTSREQPDLVDCRGLVTNFDAQELYVQMFPPGVAPTVSGAGRCVLLGAYRVTAGVPFDAINAGYRCFISQYETATPATANLKYSTGGDWIDGGPIPVNPGPTSTTSHRLTTEVDCQLPGGLVHTVLAHSVSFTNAATAPAAFPAAGCAAGEVAVGGRQYIDSATDGAAWQPSAAEWTATAPAGATNPDNPYYRCLGGNGGTPCPLQAVEPDPADATGVRTRPYVPVTNPSTGVVTRPSGCTWGPYLLTVEECGRAAEPAPQPTPTGTATATTVPRVPVVQCCDVVDPGPAEASNCWPSGWGALNPLEWVYKPVRCAIVSASKELLVPKTTGPAITETVNLAKSKAPFRQIETGAAWVVAPSDTSSTCLDLAVSFPEASRLPARLGILNSCDDSNVFVRVLHQARPLLLAVGWIVALAPLLWWAWRQYAPGSQGTA